MTLQTKRILTSAFFSLAVVSAVAIASNVTLPNTFTAGTPARAAEVNANFAAVKAAVDDSQSQITALQGLVNCPTGMTRFGSVCAESTPMRGPSNWYEASRACGQLGRRLCPSALFAASCTSLSVPNGTVTAEWTGDLGINSTGTITPINVTDISSVLTRCSFNAQGTAGSMETFTLIYRCCF